MLLTTLSQFLTFCSAPLSSAVNYGLLSDTILSSNPCNFHILFLNSVVNPSIVATKCIILDNLSQTTRIAFFPVTNSNFVIKSTIKYVHSFSSTPLNFNFPAGISVLFLSSDIYHILLHIIPHLLLLLATSNFSLPTPLFSIFLYVLLLAHYGVTRLSLPSTLHPSVHIPFSLLTSNPLLSAILLLITLLL